jgi:hypothetical protein
VPRRKQKWGLIYAATVVVCIPIALTTGNSESSHAWHEGSIMVILGIVALWRLSQQPPLL